MQVLLFDLLAHRLILYLATYAYLSRNKLFKVSQVLFNIEATTLQCTCFMYQFFCILQVGKKY